MKIRHLLGLISVSSVFFIGTANANLFIKPPIDQCPLGSSYPNPPSNNDYCHCFQKQAVTNCKNIYGGGSPTCAWAHVKAGLWSFDTKTLCGHQLNAFRRDPHYKTWLNNCINETNHYKSIGNGACKGE